VPAPGPGATGPPPSPGGAGRGATSARPSSPGRSAVTPAPAAAAKAKAAPAARSTPPPTGPGAPKPRRRKGGRRPKLRRVLLLTSLFLPLLLLLAAVGGWFYAKSVYDKVEKIPLGHVLTASSGSGTNYLIVGSDSRSLEEITEAGLNPEAFEDGGGQRSDTMLLLRFAGGEASMMSLPRDLYLPIAGTNGSGKLNSAYNGGPERLVQTVQQSLGVPVHHYMEVDFVSFSKLVDSLGGITIDFPNPAFDTNTGLRVDQAGPARLDGPQALAYVRSRRYVEIIDGRERTDPTADLGRVVRQQTFLKAVFSELGSSKNPFTLARAASSASSGLRVDDQLGLVDAIRFAWRLRSLDPAPVELPVRNGANGSGSVLLLVEPDAQAAFDQFR